MTFNVLVGMVGVASWLSVLIAGSAAVKPGADFEEPIVMLFGPIICGLMANLCYTLGWMVDTTAFRGSPRRWLFKTGLIFSLLLTAIPGVWALALWLITLHTGNKLD